jgi:O-antigen/teichoic acid export membrane protein
MLGQLKRLARHSAIYGLGGIVSRLLAVLLIPLYTRYLGTGDYGKIETLVAGSVVLSIVLRAGISSAFFRFYFDSPEPEARRLVLRTSFWFTMASATAGLVAGLLLAPEISSALFGDAGSADLVRAAFVGLWAQMNYEQLTSLFRVEERSTAFVIASLANILVTVAATVLLVVVFDKGPLGVIVGNFTGTLVVYLALLGYRREQLGLQFDRDLLRRMNRFGWPLVPSALALWATNFSDRFFLVKLSSVQEVGRYSLAVRIASAMVLLLTAFRTAWPAFAYSIEDDEEARGTYGYVLTYLLFVCSWIALALSLLAPWIVRLLAPTNRDFWPAARVVPELAFAAVAFAGYIVMAIGVGRARRTQFNWIVTGIAAALNVTLNLLLIPPYGMLGAAIATVAAFSLMFVGMTVNSQRVYRVPYQWRRVVTVVAAAVGLTLLGKALDVSLPVALALVAVYPLVLAALGFYLPAERSRLRQILVRSPA